MFSAFGWIRGVVGEVRCCGKVGLRDDTGHKVHPYSSSLEEFKAVMQTVCPGIYYAPYASLDDELCAFDARLVGDIECGIVRIVAATGNFCDGVCLGMEHIGFSDTVCLADVLKA